MALRAPLRIQGAVNEMLFFEVLSADTSRGFVSNFVDDGEKSWWHGSRCIAIVLEG